MHTKLEQRTERVQVDPVIGDGVAVADVPGIDAFSLVAAAEVGVRWVPVPAGGDRGRGALVPAVQSVLPRR